MKTVTFSFTAKFKASKVIGCFTDANFAKLHKASKLFVKAGIIKADKKMIIRTLADADKAAPTCVAIINFTEAKDALSTAVTATLVNYPDNGADIKEIAKAINADITTFLTPKPVVKAVAKKPAAKPAAKKPAAKPAAKKPAAKPAAKKPAAKKPAAKPAVTVTTPSTDK